MKIGDNGLLLVGCGKMGGALLKGWIGAGVAPDQVTVIEPYPADWLIELTSEGLNLNVPPNAPPTVTIVATKPQIMADALPGLNLYGDGPTLFISIAAGTAIASFEAMLGSETPIVRAMPNTPAAVGAGITALVSSRTVTADQRDLAEKLMGAVGKTVFLQSEDQMHAVTALSGSGPAYVFALAEAMASAGMSEGLPKELAQRLATETIAGAGKLMALADVEPSDLRVQVTSPGGTTAAGLEHLMSTNGLYALMEKTIQAASRRSRELAEDM